MNRGGVAAANGATGHSVEHDRLAYWTPRDIARRNVTGRLADILADAEIQVVLAKALFRESLRMPELRIAWVEVNEDSFPESKLQSLGGQVSADVDQKVGTARQVQQLVPAQPEAARCAVDN